MAKINISIFYKIFLPFLLLSSTVNYSQTDSLNIADTLASIDDSTAVQDSAAAPIKPASFLFEFKEDTSLIRINTFSLTKRDIDFIDYRYAGNLITYLPFGFLEDLGSLGTPNEPKIFGFGFGNISLSSENNSLANLWNGSVDMNRVQTEGISSIQIVSPHKSFLFGFNSNPAHIKIQTDDTLRSKPFSRIRYYQASSEEAFIDAFFSARVLPKLVFSFRMSNNSISDNYTNSEFGSWKFNFKGVYKLGDSLYSGLEFNHLNIHTPLNGGVDITNVALSEFDIYNNSSSVLYEDRDNQTKENKVTGRIYGYLLPFGKSNISISYFDNNDQFTNPDDTSSTKRWNSSQGYSAVFQHSIYFNHLYFDINTGYEQIEYNLASITYNNKVNNYYGSVYTNYSLLSGLVTPGLFAKISKYNEQNLFGFGAETEIKMTDNLQLTLGYSDFEKPVSIVEEEYISKNITPNINTMFASFEYSSRIISSSLSYYNIDYSDAVIPVLVQDGLYPQTGDIIFKTASSLKSNGLNFNSNIKYWNILLSTNLNYNWYAENIFNKLDDTYSIFAGVYYVDTLFNDNLNLKTGFNFYFFDKPNYSFYDFEKMRSTNFRINNETIELISVDELSSDKFKLDFFLAGRIQDAATFYFIYENILGSQYYIAPYFPMPDGGIRIGISWDFLD